MTILRAYREGAYCRVLGAVVSEGLRFYVCRPVHGNEITIAKDQPGVHVQPCSFCEPVFNEERIAA